MVRRDKAGDHAALSLTRYCTAVFLCEARELQRTSRMQVVPNNDDDDWSRKVEGCLGVDWGCGEMCGRVMWDGFGSGWVVTKIRLDLRGRIMSEHCCSAAGGLEFCFGDGWKWL
jgi:hypothetical protein